LEVRAGNSGDQQSPRNHHLLVKYILAPLAWWALVGSGGAALVVGDGARGGRGGRGGGVEGAWRGRSVVGAPAAKTPLTSFVQDQVSNEPQTCYKLTNAGRR